MTSPPFDALPCALQVHSDYEVKIKELHACVDEARAAALEYLRQLKMSRRDGGELKDQFDELKDKWEEMTDEERISRAAKELLATQDKHERESTEVRPKCFSNHCPPAPLTPLLPVSFTPGLACRLPQTLSLRPYLPRPLLHSRGLSGYWRTSDASCYQRPPRCARGSRSR